MKKENGVYRRAVLAVGLVIGVAALWLLAKVSLYIVVLCNQGLWTEAWVYRLLGVEAAYVFAHCRDEFLPVLIYRMCLYGVGFVILAAVPVLGFLIPRFRRKRGE